MKLLTSMMILVGLLPVAAFANCTAQVENAVLSTFVQDSEGRFGSSDVDVNAFLRKQVMLSLDYLVVARVKGDSNTTQYMVYAKGAENRCEVVRVKKTSSLEGSDSQPVQSIAYDNSYEDRAATLQIGPKKYTVKKAILDAAILSTIPIAYNNFERDKFYHYVAGASAALVANRICYGLVFKKSRHRELYSNICGLGSAVLAGALKEAYDSKFGGDVDVKDFAYTTLGGAVVTLRFTLF